MEASSLMFVYVGSNARWCGQSKLSLVSHERSPEEEDLMQVSVCADPRSMYGTGLGTRGPVRPFASNTSPQVDCAVIKQEIVIYI